uniref:mitochondrial import inner membrane translocase subunit TIM14 n=1 Tax=Monopterus albus TaxID=43700 RepID=UPI0009B49CF0|nr:mitochondrial import inner membrane translocase subunit TIM14 [Monopterus albus]
MASSIVAVGLAIAAAGFAGRYAMQAMKQMEPQVKQALQCFPKTAFGGGYYRGGFEPKMTKREAALVLGVRYVLLLTSSLTHPSTTHRKLMILNHPDRGGSPYLAAKINEAKDLMDGQTKN